MAYTLTQDQKDWMQSMIDIMPAGSAKTNAQTWLSGLSNTITDPEINSVEAYFSNTPYYSQVQQWGEWIKGGSRPGQPH